MMYEDGFARKLLWTNQSISQHVVDEEGIKSTGCVQSPLKGLDMTTGGRSEPFTFWIDGAPYSKANSRRLVNIKTKTGNRTRSIKSENALMFSNDFIRQCPVLPLLFKDDVHLDMDIYYPDRRRDLDESLVLDLMQDRIYANDRQVKSRRVRWGLSADKPGMLITVRPIRLSDYAGGE